MKVTILPENKTISVEAGVTVMEALRAADILLDAPCGGNGICGKCKVSVTVNGETSEVLACNTPVTADMTVTTHGNARHAILTAGTSFKAAEPDGGSDLCMAFDIGTTTVVGHLLDGGSGAVLTTVSTLNPQREYGADVISRIQHALDGGMAELKGDIRGALNDLIRRTVADAEVDAARIGIVSVVGNTCMHHLFMGLDCSPLVVPPYMPSERKAMEFPAAGVLDAAPKATVRLLANIAGFVGADTVGCLLSCDFGRIEPLTLMIDIGTNGEMVLGNHKRRLACSTAAGPAFEGAKITCGMRGAEGAIDHVFLNDKGRLTHTVIGKVKPAGICGSGLLDAVAALLEAGLVSEEGRVCKPDELETDTARANADRLIEIDGKPAVLLSGTAESGVYLTQKDIREVQLAKAAICAGIELMAQHLDVKLGDIDQVFLAGAFGNYLKPESACAIGMIPPVLLDKIVPIGNAAGEGAKLAALSRAHYAESSRLAEETEFLELASLPEFQDCYVDNLLFGEDE